MRIERFDLIAFGPFADETLDLARGADLHLIVGDNEAGKSTSLRGVCDLLFGIPLRTQDAHRHPMPNLRLGALLSAADGSSLDLVRRKGSKNTLSTPAGDPIDDAVLARLLSGVDRELFETMFGLSHDRLVRGGRALLAAGGSVGEALFGAGLGATGLHDLLRDLDGEAEMLFRPNGQNPVVNAAMRALADARREARELALPASEWRGQNETVEAARTARDELDRSLLEARAEVTRLERLKRVLPLVAERQALLEALSELGEFVPVAEGAPVERIGALDALEQAETSRERARAKGQALEEELRRLDVPREIVSRAAEITALHQEIGKYVKAGQDLPRIQAELDQAEAEAQKLAATTGVQLACAELEQRRPQATIKARVATLGDDHVRLEERQRAAREEHRIAVASFERHQRALETPPPPADPTEVKAALAAAQRAGDVEAKLDAAALALAEKQADIGARLAALPLWQGPLAALESLAVPSANSLERFESAFAELRRERATQASERERRDERLKEVQTELRELELATELPTDDELRAARAHRDHGWELVRATWLHGMPLSDARANFDPEHDLDHAYGLAVGEADRVVDAQRLQAHRVARRAGLIAEREVLEADLERLDQDDIERQGRTSELEESWRAVWEGCGLAPLAPAEMQPWLRTQQKLVELAGAARAATTELEQLRAERDRHRRALSQALARIGSPSLAKEETLAGGLERGQATVAALEQGFRARETKQERLEELSAQAEAAADKVADVEDEIQAWQTAWQTAVAALGLPSAAKPAEAQALLSSLEQLFGSLDSAAALRRRVEGMERDRDEFALKAHALAADLAPDLAEMPLLEQAIGLLNERRTEAETRATRAALLTQQIAEQEVLQRDATLAEADARRRLDALRVTAGCQSFDELEDLERRSVRRRELEATLAASERSIVAAGASGLERLVEESSGLDPDELEARIPLAERKVEEVENERSRLSEEIGRAEAALRLMDGSGDAAGAAERAQAALATVRRAGEQYLTTRLAALLLRRAIERYREDNEGPLIERANELFPLLTVRSFDGIGTRYDEKGQLILIGRRGRDEVPVEGMSDGTRDQLYLALRIAALEQHFRANGPMPVVADDLLINFDDRRAAAALRVLAELSRSTQVMVFTHHRHLIELARATLEADLFSVHELQPLGPVRLAAA